MGIFSFSLLNYCLREKTYFARTFFSKGDILKLTGVILSMILLELLCRPSFPFCLWAIAGIFSMLFTLTAANLTAAAFLSKQGRRKDCQGKLWIMPAIAMTILELVAMGFFDIKPCKIFLAITSEGWPGAVGLSKHTYVKRDPRNRGMNLSTAETPMGATIRRLSRACL